MPAIVPFGLNTFNSTQPYISYKIFKILLLISDVAFMFLGLRDKI